MKHVSEEQYIAFINDLLSLLDDVHCYPRDIFGDTKDETDKAILTNCGYGDLFEEDNGDES